MLAFFVISAHNLPACTYIWLYMVFPNHFLRLTVYSMNNIHSINGGNREFFGMCECFRVCLVDPVNRIFVDFIICNDLFRYLNENDYIFFISVRIF